MFNVGDTVRLTGITRRGKNYVREQGAKHTVMERGILNAPSRQGDAWLLNSGMPNDTYGYGLRWVLVVNDPDLKIEPWRDS